MTDIPASRALHSASPAGHSRPPHASDPVVLPTPTIRSMTDQICATALRERAFSWWWIAMIPASALAGVLIAAIVCSVIFADWSPKVTLLSDGQNGPLFPGWPGWKTAGE